MNNKKFDQILSLYENFCLYEGQLITKKEAFDYVSSSSLHSYITKWAYGEPLHRMCIDISDGTLLQSKVTVLNQNDRYYVKLISCLVNWEIYYNDLTIKVNGTVIHQNNREFIENVNLGWPTIYYPIADGLIKDGENTISVSTNNSSGAGFYVARVDLISLPEIKLYSQISCIRAARQGSAYIVAFQIPESGKVDNIICEDNCRLIDIIYPKFKSVCLVKLISDKVGTASCSVEFEDGTVVQAVLPDIVRASSDVFLAGMDSDDHRHDKSDENKRIPEIFAMTGMGNYFQFRPQIGRNFLDFDDTETWKDRIDYLKAFGNKLGVCGSMNILPDLAGEQYYGSHIHEPYLFFCLPLEMNPEEVAAFHIDANAVRASESFGESEQLYRNILRRIKEETATTEGLCSVGSPSMLCIYEAAEGFDRVTIEPVSNINILTGAVRGTKPKFWGAHVPVDWYFGALNDSVKSKKFKLALNYLYINGADYTYSENALFKTNAFSREDWEDIFCCQNRTYLRDFYEFTIRNPREGMLKVDKAVVYGRHEHFYWHHDDRIGELADMKDWDRKVWGKWEDDSYRKCWRAIDAWLPSVETNINEFKHPANLKLFSGTPFGNVDVIPFDQSYSGYRAIVFLGWNTMNDALLDKIKAYVAQGGTLLISYCHLNYTDRNDMPVAFPCVPKDLLGVKVEGEFKAYGSVKFDDGITFEIPQTALAFADCTETTAKAIAYDENGKSIYFHNYFGKGQVYFAAFQDYFCETWAIESFKHVMERIGEAGDVFCDNPSICFTERMQDDGSRIFHLLNMNCTGNGSEAFSLKIQDKIIQDSVKAGEVKVLKIR